METLIIMVVMIAFFVWRIKPGKGINSISAAELKGMWNDKDKVFIDVRTSAEYKSRSIKQFRNMPLGSDYSKLPKDKEIVVICQSGIRSGNACKRLKKLGYEKVTNVRGGMNAY